MRHLTIILSLLLVAVASATPPDAKVVLANAQTRAMKEGKNVLVIFHASWCGWCKKFDKMLEEPSLKPSFDRSYVIVRLDVMEKGEQKALENPGGETTMETLGGKGAGLPFYAVVSASGKKIGDSLQTPGKANTNTGHPAEPGEIAHFMELLKKTALKTDERTRGEIEAYLKAKR